MTKDTEKAIARFRSKSPQKSDEEILRDEEKFKKLGNAFKKIYSIKITKEVNATKALIAEQAPDPPEQGVFSFLPTTVTRTSPFHPMSKREMKDRSLPTGGLSWKTPWGRITIKGEKLSIYDESVLLTVLLLMKKDGKDTTFKTTRHEICKVMNVTPCKDTYKAIWGSLDRLTGAKINLEIWDTKTKGKGKKKKTKRRMTNTILSGAVTDEETGKLLITVNSYFLEMFAENLVTNINLKLRASLKGDISKALYRFYRGQRGMTYDCHLLTLCRAINLEIDMELFRLRSRIRIGLRELKKAGYLQKRSIVTKSDMVKIWKTPKKGTCVIEDARGPNPPPVKA